MKLIMAEKNDQCETDQKKRIYSFRLNWGLIFGFFLRWISIVTLKLRENPVWQEKTLSFFTKERIFIERSQSASIRNDEKWAKRNHFVLLDWPDDSHCFSS